VTSRDTNTPGAAGEDRREIRPSSPDPLGDPREAVQELVERACKAKGNAKGLAGHVPVGYAQIRKWVGDGGLPGLDDILLLIKIVGPSDPFRQALIDQLEAMFDPTPAQIATAVKERVDRGEPIADAVEDALGIAQIYPGRWVRVRR
jgi:hypothetical protein